MSDPPNEPGSGQIRVEWRKRIMSKRRTLAFVGLLLLLLVVALAGTVAPRLSRAGLSRLSDAELVIRTTKNPRDVPALTELAERMEKAGMVGEALTDYYKVTEVHPTDIRAWRKIAQLAVRQRDPKATREAAGKLTEIGSKDADALRDAATAYAALGDDLSGRSTLEKAVQIAPTDAAAWDALAEIHTRRNALLKAVEAASRATRLAPEVARYWLHLAVAKRLSANAPGAIEAIDQAARLDPADPEIHLERGILFAQTGRTPEERQWAETALLKAREGLRGKPRETEALRRLGQFYLAEKRFEDSEKALRECLRLAPDDTSILFALTRVLGLQGRKAQADDLTRKFAQQNAYELAVRQLRLRVQREPHRADLWNRLAELYESHGDTAAAGAARARGRDAAP